MNTISIDSLAVKARFFHGLSDPTRLAILHLLKEGELTVSGVVTATGQTQSNISNHLKCLSECGLVTNRREGKNIWYALKDIDTKKLLSLSDEVVNKVYPDIEQCIVYK